MKKFEFSLERVLQVRRIREKEKQREMAVVVKQFETEQQTLQKICAEEQKLVDIINDYQTNPHSASLTMLYYNLEGKRTKRQQQTRRVANVKQKLDAIRDALLKSSQEKKSLEKLREHKYEKYLQDVFKEEQKSLDDVAVIKSANNSLNTI